jgi:hypothetical protein
LRDPRVVPEIIDHQPISSQFDSNRIPRFHAQNGAIIHISLPTMSIAQLAEPDQTCPRLH